MQEDVVEDDEEPVANNGQEDEPREVGRFFAVENLWIKL